LNLRHGAYETPALPLSYTAEPECVDPKTDGECTTEYCLWLFAILRAKRGISSVRYDTAGHRLGGINHMQFRARLWHDDADLRRARDEDLEDEDEVDDEEDDDDFDDDDDFEDDDEDEDDDDEDVANDADADDDDEDDDDELDDLDLDDDDEDDLDDEEDEDDLDDDDADEDEEEEEEE
jgi:hypothetical protein